MSSHTIPSDDIYPRDADHRYRLYALENDQPVVRACASDPGGIGAAIVQLGEDRREAGLAPELVAVLDAVERRWLSSLWKGGPA